MAIKEIKMNKHMEAHSHPFTPVDLTKNALWIQGRRRWGGRRRGAVRDTLPPLMRAK